jgi:hypothetical protein
MLPTPFVPVQNLFTLSLFQMAEEGWTQGNCQAAPGFPSLLIDALESLSVTERPRYSPLQGDPGHRQEQPLPQHPAVASDCHRV